MLFFIHNKLCLIILIVAVTNIWSLNEKELDGNERHYRRFGLTWRQSEHKKSTQSPQISNVDMGFIKFIEKLKENMRKKSLEMEEVRRAKILKEKLFSRVYAPVLNDFYSRF